MEETKTLILSMLPPIKRPVEELVFATPRKYIPESENIEPWAKRLSKAIIEQADADHEWALNHIGKVFSHKETEEFCGAETAEDLKKECEAFFVSPWGKFLNEVGGV